MAHKITIAPSILAADFGRLCEEAQSAEAAGADMLHVDVMDGMFVPNISFGPCVVQALRKATRLPLDVHMMVQQPERYVDDMADAGANIITLHAEATQHIHRALMRVRRHTGVQAGVALNPGTPVSALECLLPEIDLVLIMTVNPGFGGQKLIVPALSKITQARAMLDAIGSGAWLEVDGGVSTANVREFTSRGADLLISGTEIFRAADRAAVIRAMREN